MEKAVVANDMNKRWIRRSDKILLWMIILWFIGAGWGLMIETASFIVQAIKFLREPISDYYGYSEGIRFDIGEILLYIGGPVTGGIVTWLIKNMIEATTRNKLNPGYLKTHLPDEECGDPVDPAEGPVDIP